MQAEAPAAIRRDGGAWMCVRVNVGTNFTAVHHDSSRKDFLSRFPYIDIFLSVHPARTMMVTYKCAIINVHIYTRARAQASTQASVSNNFLLRFDG